jgi:hypothetical protein
MSRNPLLKLPEWFRAVLVVLLVMAAVAVRHRLFPGSPGVMIAAAPLLLGPIAQLGKSYQNLLALTRPADSSQPESIPHVLYDTQPYAAAGSAALTFFRSATAANAADPTLSNFATGQLDAGYYFEIHRMHVFIHALANFGAAAAITGAANDVEILHKTARGTVGWVYKGKPYGPVPLTYFGRPGGPVPIFAAFGAGTAANNVVSAGETENNGGFPVLGNLILAPATQFTATIQFNATAISALTNITLSLMGVLHRPVG